MAVQRTEQETDGEMGGGRVNKVELLCSLHLQYSTLIMEQNEDYKDKEEKQDKGQEEIGHGTGERARQKKNAEQDNILDNQNMVTLVYFCDLLCSSMGAFQISYYHQMVLQVHC